MALVRPTDQGSLLIAVHTIIDQLEQQARGTRPIVDDPKVLGAWIESSGVTLGKLATSYSDAPPGYQVASGSRSSDLASAATTEASAATVVTASSFTADGSRSVDVSFSCPSWDNGFNGVNTAFLSLFDGSTSLGWLASPSFPAVGSPIGPVTATTRITPSAGSHTLSVRLWALTNGTTIRAGGGGSGVRLPATLLVSVE